MKKIAITGTVACGKSTVLRHFSKCFPVFNCDDAIRDLYHQSDTISEIKKKFTMETFCKEKLIQILVQNKHALKSLEAILYPKLHKMMNEFERKARRFSKIAFFEVPLLLEKNLEKNYDKVIILNSTKWKRKKNFLKRGGSEAMFHFLNSNQWSDAKKSSIAKKKDFTLISALGRNISYKNLHECTRI
jgi:dephospho-CoA kinase